MAITKKPEIAVKPPAAEQAKAGSGDFKKGRNEEGGWTLAKPQIVARMKAISDKGLDGLLPLLPKDAIGREFENGFELVDASEGGKSLMGLYDSMAHVKLSFDGLPAAGLLVYATSSLTYALFFSREKRVAVRAVVSRMGESAGWEKVAEGLGAAESLGLERGYAVYNLRFPRAYDESGNRASQI